MALRYGMIGGGRGAFIGGVHRIAASLDGRAHLAAGALSIDPAEAIESGKDLGLPPDRTYRTWREMIDAEGRRTGDDRLDWVSIVTPNHAHFEIAHAALEAGLNVVCEKPLVTTSEQARALVSLVERSGAVFAVTYNYTGYPMVRHAAHLVRSGHLGTIRKVFVSYRQGWLATKLEASGQPQASWRTDPTKAGLGGAIGDIGSHAENLVSAVTGLEIESLCADLTAFVPGRPLDDDASVLLRFRGGARGILTASQICIGEENNLTLQVYGDKGSLRWSQEDPNRLDVTTLNAATRVVTRGGPEASDPAARATRLPSGHPEGFFEAFANIYRGVADAVTDRKAGRPRSADALPFPTVHDGARGVAFIEHAVRSSRAGGQWLAFAP